MSAANPLGREVLQRAVPPVAILVLMETPELDRRRPEESLGVGVAKPLRRTGREGPVVLASLSSLDRPVDVWDQPFHSFLGWKSLKVLPSLL